MRVLYIKSIERALSAPSISNNKCAAATMAWLGPLLGGALAAGGTYAASQAASSAGSIMNEETAYMQAIENEKARIFNRQEAEKARAHQVQERKDSFVQQSQFTKDMMDYVNQYNSPVNQLGLMRDAGINPMALQGQGYQSFTPSTPSPQGVAGASASTSPVSMSGIGQLAASMQGKKFDMLQQTFSRIGELAEKIPMIKADIDLKREQVRNTEINNDMQELQKKMMQYEFNKNLDADTFLSQSIDFYKDPETGRIYSPQLHDGAAPSWWNKDMSKMKDTELPEIVKGVNMAGVIKGLATQKYILRHAKEDDFGLSKAQYDSLIQSYDNAMIDEWKNNPQLKKDGVTFAEWRDFMNSKDYRYYRQQDILNQANIDLYRSSAGLNMEKQKTEQETQHSIRADIANKDADTEGKIINNDWNDFNNLRNMHYTNLTITNDRAEWFNRWKAKNPRKRYHTK